MNINNNRRVLRLTARALFAFASTLASLNFAVAQEQRVSPIFVNPLKVLQNFLSRAPAELLALLDSGKLAEADVFFEKEKAFFSENKSEHEVLLSRLASAINGLYESRIVEASKGLSFLEEQNYKDWRLAKKIIQHTNDLTRDYASARISQVSEYKDRRIDELSAKVLEVSGWYRKNANLSFLEYDYLSDDNFFSVYPVELEKAKILVGREEEFLKRLSTFDFERIASFWRKYGSEMALGPSLARGLGKAASEALLTLEPQPHTIATALVLAGKLKQLGLPMEAPKGLELAFIEVTSKTLLAEGQIEFPLQVDLDLPFTPSKADLDALEDAAAGLKTPYFLIFDVSVSRVNRRVLSKKDHDSRYVSSVRSVPNPAYEVARSQVYQAQMDVIRIQSTYTQGLAATILNGIAAGIAQANVGKARTVLSSTPSTLSQDVYSDYKYSTSEIDVRRVSSVNYYLVDREKKNYYKGNFDIEESKAFSISYNINDKDPGRSGLLSRQSSEDDIVRFEKAPMTVKASTIIENYVASNMQHVPLVDVSGLRSEMLRDKNTALAAYKSKQFDAKPVNDDRFGSVVVVMNPRGSQGAGFYVAPDLVLTNFHVVEGSQFIEMKLHNGLETFGKVVKSDVRLDLALVKVQSRGTPVKLFEGNTLELGATVEAIGHPKGLQFTITRGVVSAVRKRPSVYGVGGKDVLFVQTDAAINPGNSGGPLFLGDKVIAVNNNKLASGSEGLGFSIHYSEVKDFLRESF